MVNEVVEAIRAKNCDSWLYEIDMFTVSHGPSSHDCSSEVFFKASIAPSTFLSKYSSSSALVFGSNGL